MNLFGSISASAGLLLASCASHSPPPRIKPYRADYVGAWVNPFKGDPTLAAAEVHQYGECSYDNWLYDGKHPCAIWFYFWDGRVRQMEFEPDGKVRSDFVLPGKLKPGDASWTGADFSVGSDPQFKRHRDPRPATSSKEASKKS